MKAQNEHKAGFFRNTEIRYNPICYGSPVAIRLMHVKCISLVAFLRLWVVFNGVTIKLDNKNNPDSDGDG